MEMISGLVATFLVNALWQVALVAAAAALAARLMRSAPARYQHFVWLAALGLSLALPAASLRLAAGANTESSRDAIRGVQEIPLASNGTPNMPPAEESRTGSPTPTAVSAASHSRASGQPFRIPALAISAALARYVAVGFLLFLLLRLAGFVGVWRRTQAVARSAHSKPLPSWATELLEHSRRAFGVGSVSVLFSRKVRSPLTLGARQPVIVLPEGFLERTNQDELASALSHEMAHLARHDYLLNLVAEIIYLPVAFHPAARLIRRRINETREFACDELAAGRLVPACDYARSLVAIADTLAVATQISQPDYSLGVFDTDNLEERVMRLLHPSPRAGARFAKALLAAGSFLIVAAFAAASFPLSVAQTTAETVPKVSLKQFAGTWTAKYEGQTYIEVILKPNGDELGGSVSLGNFGVDENGQVNHVADEPNPDYAEPLVSSHLQGDTLSLVARGKSGVENSFQMKVAGTDEAKIKWLPATHAPSAPEPGWWAIARVPTNTEIKVTLGGPSGRVVGGVPGGLGGGVPGLTRAVEAEATPARKVTPEDAVNVVRLINTAEADYNSERGKYASWQDLLNSPSFQETLARTRNVYHLEKNALASGPEVIPGYQLRLAVSPGGDHYILSLEEAPFKDCTIFFYSDDRGIIQEGKNIGCSSSGRGLNRTAPSAKPENEETPGGPSAGTVGGVPGGVAGGVPGQVRTVEGEVKGSTSDTVSDPSGPGTVEGTVSGVVEDPSGRRLAHAVVSLIGKAGGSDRTAATDEKGEFLIEHVTPGSYRLMVRYPNFERSVAEINVVGPENKTVVNVIMSPRGLMEWVTVTAKKPREVRENPAPGETDKIREGGQLIAGKPLYKTEPQYPESSKKKGIQGDVILEAVISTEGVPLGVKVIQSPDPDLAKAAMAAVKQWRYQPAKLNGVPVEVVTDITMRFTLEN
jgi:TonB family protein